MADRPIGEILPLSGGGKSPKIDTFPASRTWVNPGVDLVFVRGIGGGGGGGACEGPGGNLWNAGGGGGAGQWCDWTPVPVVGNVLVTIGSAGLGSTVSTLPGGNGGNTLFGTLLRLLGGGGGESMDSALITYPAAGPVGSLGGAAFGSPQAPVSAGCGGGILGPDGSALYSDGGGLGDYYQRPGTPGGSQRIPIVAGLGFCEFGWAGNGGSGVTDSNVAPGYGGDGGGVISNGQGANGSNAKVGGFGCGGGGGVQRRVAATFSGGDGTPGWLQVLWYE